MPDQVAEKLTLTKSLPDIADIEKELHCQLWIFDISTIKEQCKQSIVAYSWQMAFAKDEAEFNSLLKEMQDTVNGLGYDQVLAVDQKNCEGQNAAIKEASAK